MSTVAPAATLRGFYREIIRPDLLRNKISKSHLEAHDAAIARFETFVGTDVRLADVTTDLVLKFEAHLWEVAPSGNRCRILVDAIKRILGFRSNFRFHNRRIREPLPAAPAGSLRHFYESVYITHRFVGRSQETIEEYRGVFYQMYLHYKRDLMLAELTDALAADHFRWLGLQGRTFASLNRVRSEWFAVWRYAHKLGHCTTTPRLAKFPDEQPAPDAWDREELQRIIANCRVLEGKEVHGIPAEKYWGALIRTCYYTALRKRSLLTLARSDVDLEEATLTTSSVNMKNRRGQKFRLGDDAVRAIQAIWLPDRVALFPPYEKKTMYRDFARIVEAAGVQPSKSHSPYFHKLRRSVGTVICDTKGIHAAAELLGHSATFVTRRYVDQTKLSGFDHRDVLTPLPE